MKLRKKTAFAATVALLSLSAGRGHAAEAAVCGVDCEDARRADTEPVFAKDFPDPYVLRVGDMYYAYSTNDREVKVPVLRSEDLLNWEELGDALHEIPEWAGSAGYKNWAPAVLQVEDEFILYYTTRYRKKKAQAISYAVSRSPEGPFVDSSREPLIFQEEAGGSIDPEVFTDRDGSYYLLWKSDANSRGLPSAIYVQKLAADGRTLRGEPHRLIEVDQEWEEPLVENPSLLRRGDRYYLIYSANWWQSDRYAVGYATGPSPTGPFVKQEGKPILQSQGERELGPGGASFFFDRSGKPWIAYHAWSAPHTNYWGGGERSLHLARVGFDGERLRFYRWDGTAAMGGCCGKAGNEKE